MTPRLQCRGLTVGYGSLTVVRNVDLSLSDGTVLALLGPNGAGKTTMLSAMAGLLAHQGGEVILDGTVLPSGKAQAANRAGLVLVPDNRCLFTTLSVGDNLRAAAPKDRDAIEKVAEMFPALRRRWKVTAGSLSGGEQQMLAIGRALVQRPRALLIDELSMGLAPLIVTQLLDTVRRAADEMNTVVVLVEQHVRLALDVADEAIVLVHGEAVLSAPAHELAADIGRVEAAYLGENR